MGLQNEKGLGLPVNGRLCLHGWPGGVGEAGSQGVHWGHSELLLHSRVNQVPVIALQAPRVREEIPRLLKKNEA